MEMELFSVQRQTVQVVSESATLFLRVNKSGFVLSAVYTILVDQMTLSTANQPVIVLHTV